MSKILRNFSQKREPVVSEAGGRPEEKAIVEFMRDGPRSTGKAIQWLAFAKFISERDRYDIDQDTKTQV